MGPQLILKTKLTRTQETEGKFKKEHSRFESSRAETYTQGFKSELQDVSWLSQAQSPSPQFCEGAMVEEAEDFIQFLSLEKRKV